MDLDDSRALVGESGHGEVGGGAVLEQHIDHLMVDRVVVAMEDASGDGRFFFVQNGIDVIFGERPRSSDDVVLHAFGIDLIGVI